MGVGAEWSENYDCCINLLDVSFPEMRLLMVALSDMLKRFDSDEDYRKKITKYYGCYCRQEEVRKRIVSLSGDISSAYDLPPKYEDD